MDDRIQKLETLVEELRQELIILKQRKVYQQDVIPGAIKNRAMGEANSYVVNVLAADIPTVGTPARVGTPMMYAEDEKKLYIWSTVNTAWETVTFT